MSSLDSVSGWIAQLEGGDDVAAEKLWERYFRRLVGLARTKLRDTPRQAADEEDVALSAFDSFCRGTQEGRFPRLNDRDDLWRLLVAITVRKAIDLTRHERRQKRAAGAAVGLAPPPAVPDSDIDEAEIDQILGREPTPELAAQVADECERLMSVLGETSLRSVALGKMEGYSDAEIAAQLGCARRTVVRKLRRIRSLWSQETLS